LPPCREHAIFGVVDPVRTQVRRSYRLIPYNKVRIAVVRGPDAGVAMDIAGTVLRVGTSPESDLVLSDDRSRHHCELENAIRHSRATPARPPIALGGRVYDAVIRETSATPRAHCTGITWLGER
jgi:hypothetical protein